MKKSEQSSAERSPTQRRTRSYLLGLTAVLATWGVFFLVLWPKMLYQNASGIWAGWINVWGDWAAHLTYASVFAYRQPADWFTSHPLFLGAKFTYPFLADAISGWLMRFGVGLIPAFILPSIVLTFLLLVAMYKFYFLFLKSGKQAFVALSLNLFSGGLGFLWFFKDVLAKPTWDTLWFPPQEYTHMAANKIEWITLITSQIVPQRAFLLGLPIVLGMLIILHKWVTSKKEISDANFMALGAASSLLLFVHVHSFIAFVFFSAAYALVYSNKWRTWFIFAVSAAIPSAILFSLLFGGEIHSGFFKIYPWWMANVDADNINWVYFWWLNWGLFLPFSLIAAWRTKFYKHPMFIGAVMIFLVANFVLFQPFNWDNSKLLSFTYLVFCIPSAQMLAMMWRKKQLVMRALALFAAVFMCLSGGLDLSRMLHTDRVTNMLLSTEEIHLADQFRKISQPNDVVLTSDQHNLWVPTLTGRQLLMGYRGWLWTYGIDYGDRETDVLSMFDGSDDAPALLDKYQVKFVVIGPTEREIFNANEAYFASHYPIVLQSALYKVFKIN